MQVNGKSLYVQPLNQTHATEKYASWLNDPQTNKYLETKKATVQSLKQYIRQKNNSRECILRGIFLEGEHIGNIKLEPIDFKQQTAILGILLGEKQYRGMGIATQIIKHITKLAANWNIKTITAGVYKDNKASLKAFKKAGYKISKETKNAFWLTKH